MGFFEFKWEEEKIRILLERIHQHSDETVTCWMKIEDNADDGLGHLYGGNFNLGAPQTRSMMAKNMAALKPKQTQVKLDWRSMLEVVCNATVDYLGKGEPFKRFGNCEVKRGSHWLFPPFVPLGMPGSIFGDGGLGKSLLAQAISVSVQIGYDGMELKPHHQTNVLYLDWETTWDFWAARLEDYCAGMSLPEVPRILYDHPKRKFVNDLERISNIVIAENIGFMVIDSVAIACGGDVSKEEGVLNFYGGLEQIGISSLLVGHTSKEQKKHKTMYGNVYWSNLSRSVWEIRKDQQPETNALNIALYHRKCNIDKEWRPMGFQFRFADKMHTISRCDETLKQVDTFEKELPLKYRIMARLEKQDWRLEDLCEDLKEQKSTVKVRLSELKKQGKVINLSDNRWGAVDRHATELQSYSY